VKGKTGNLIKAIGWYTICNVIIKCIGYLTAPVFNRILSVDAVGMISNIMAWTNVLSNVITLNLMASVANAFFDFDSEDFDRFKSSIILLEIVLCLIFEIVCFGVGHFLSNVTQIDTKYLWLVILYVFASQIVSIEITKNQIQQKYMTVIIYTLFSTLSVIVLSIVLLEYMNDEIMARLLGLYSPVIICAIAVFVAAVCKKASFNHKMNIYAIKIGFPLIFHLLASSVLASSDVIMINKYNGYDKGALYSVAYSAATISLTIFYSFNSAWAPWCYARYSEDDYRNVDDKIPYVLGVFGLLFVLISIMGPEIVWVLGGDYYVQACYVIPPVLSGFIFMVAYTFYCNLEQFNKKNTYVASGTICAAIINLLLNFIMIPYFGYIVAAYTTMISYCALLVFHFIVSKYMLSYGEYYNNMRVFIVSILMAVIILSTQLFYQYMKIRYIMELVLICISIAVLIRKKDVLTGEMHEW